MTILKMVQVGTSRWQLLAPNGKVLVDDVPAYSEYEAEMWAKAYVSSYPSWDVDIVPMKKDKTK